MSHQTPATLLSALPSPAQFIVTTNAGSTTVSGILALHGGAGITTSASGNTVLVTGVGSPVPTAFVGNFGTASADSNAILQFHSLTPFVQTTASQNTVSVDVQLSTVQIGGLGHTSLASNSLLFGSGAAPVGLTNPALDGQILLAATGGPPEFASVTSTGGTLQFTPGPNSLNIEVNFFNNTLFNPLIVPNGGTGQSILTLHSVLIGEGSNPIQTTNVGTDGQVLIASSTGNPLFETITSTGGTLSFILGPNSLNIDVDLFGSSFFNPLPVENGGTGNTILTSYGVLLGEGSLAIEVTPPGTDGQVLLASSTGDPLFETITSTGGTITFTYGPNALNMDFLYPQTFPIPLTPSIGATGRSILTIYGVLVGEGTPPVNVTAAGTDGQTLIASSIGDPAFATITSTGNTLLFTAGPNALNIEVDPASITFTSKVPVSSGGSGRTIFTAYSVLVGDGSLGIFAIAPGTNGQVLIASSTGMPKFSTITSTGNTLTFQRGYNTLNMEASLANNSFFNPLVVPNGGTGRSLFTAFSVLLGEGSLAVGATNVGTNGQTLIASSTGDPKFVRITSTGGSLTFTFGYNSLNIDVLNSHPIVIIADSGTATPIGNALSMLGVSGLTTIGDGALTIFIEIDPNNNTFFNPIPVQNGGTGITLLTQFGVLVGEGSNDIHVTAPGTDGQLLLASSTGDPAFNTVTSTGNTLTFIAGNNALNIDVNFSSTTLFNPLIVPNGGTGRTVLTTYGVLIGEGSRSVNVTPPGTNGQALIASSTGDPAFSTITSTGNTFFFTAGPDALNIDVNFAAITLLNPILVPRGGTGNSLLTQYGVLFGEGSLPVGATSAGTDGQILLAASTAPPAFATVSSTGLSIAFTPGPNALNMEVNFSGYPLFNPVPVKNGGTGLTLLTVFGVLVGEGSNSVHVTPPGTDGQLLIASSTGDPLFATVTSTGNTVLFTAGNNALNIDVNFSSSVLDPLPVPNGGTDTTSFTPYAVICGGTTGTAPFQNVASLGTVGQVLLSNGPGTLPSFQTVSGSSGSVNNINIQVFTANGTYTPSPNLNYCVMECVGGGGGGGGSYVPGTNFVAIGSGGGGGGYAKRTIPAGSIGGPQTVTIGTGGTGGKGSLNPPNGSSGGTTSIGALLSASGGRGGSGYHATGAANGYIVFIGGNGGVGSNGDLNCAGAQGATGWVSIDISGSNDWGLGIGGAGGNSFYGAGAFPGSAGPVSIASNPTPKFFPGNPGNIYGGGGSGAGSLWYSTTPINGGNGAPGIVIITEFTS